MSDSDSFIEEVTEEVRRDRLFRLFKRYGWIAALVILVIVGGTSYNEYRKAKARTQAEAMGDAIIGALAVDARDTRADRLGAIAAETPGGQVVVAFLSASALAESGQQEAAAEALESIARNGEVPEIYRQIAGFKALTLRSDTLPAEDLRLQFEALAQPGAPLRLLAEEQLALLDIAQGQPEAAIGRLQTMLQDAEIGADLQQRAAQVIVALGGEPQLRPGPQG